MGGGLGRWAVGLSDGRWRRAVGGGRWAAGGGRFAVVAWRRESNFGWLVADIIADIARYFALGVTSVEV